MRPKCICLPKLPRKRFRSVGPVHAQLVLFCNRRIKVRSPRGARACEQVCKFVGRLKPPTSTTRGFGPCASLCDNECQLTLKAQAQRHKARDRAWKWQGAGINPVSGPKICTLCGACRRVPPNHLPRSHSETNSHRYYSDAPNPETGSRRHRSVKCELHSRKAS